MTDKKFGNRFKECRESLRLTQEDLADMIGISVQYISYVERGKRYPRYDKMILLLDALEISADEVFCDVVKKSMDHRSSYLSDKLASLPATEKNDILDLLEHLIKQATKRAERNESLKEIDNPPKT
ncbi:helix-turn-helix transcriptional regulator [Acutalibacter muris]|uniref:Transcriptional regulator n=1 Tax=Acutalibacter muris TaxID=1796620 RepID=A0A1Z2XPD5_9FIRM|nr:helix-turn-helix transcriptional regulator [Acutalibacter muris]ANU53019.1 transcriptional regulator [Hungateiclostridiaceae bacterium KB18]ASB40305.1 transcriptional regulator [Acutalibacter muris]QQR29597.1 helix-turn-helix transcriptional regulator [Acutalibacter muris]